MHVLDGSCHCGAITVAIETALAPEAMRVRACACSFCARHRPRYTSDPDGRVTFRAADDALVRYRFGHALADFLLCGRCGVFVGAYEPGEPPRAVVNLNVLAAASRFPAPPPPLDFDAEDATTRAARHARVWTPAELVVAR